MSHVETTPNVGSVGVGACPGCPSGISSVTGAVKSVTLRTSFALLDGAETLGGCREGVPCDSSHAAIWLFSPAA